jgi:hypothetical protein
MEEPAEKELRAPQAESAGSAPALALVASLAVAIVSIVLAGISGGPYLDLSSLNLWVAVFAVAAFGALLLIPFATERRLKAAHPEQGEFSERSLLIWGGAAAITLFIGAVLIAAYGFSPASSLADAIGLLLVIDAGMVVATLIVWILSD